MTEEELIREQCFLRQIRTAEEEYKNKRLAEAEAGLAEQTARADMAEAKLSDTEAKLHAALKEIERLKATK